MKRVTACVLAILATLGSVHANLGDRSDRIDDLYGNLVERQLRDDGTVSVLYGKGRYRYRVIFANDRSISESYSHMNGKDLSEKEIAKFLKGNSAGGTWIPVNTSTERRFKRSDNRAEATYGSINGHRALTVRELPGKGTQRDE